MLSDLPHIYEAAAFFSHREKSLSERGLHCISTEKTAAKCITWLSIDITLNFEMKDIIYSRVPKLAPTLTILFFCVKT